MKTIVNNSRDPFYNLALEEYLLKKVDIDDDLFYLWRNKPCVILGRNQNPFKEVNIEYANENKIDIVRRSSGGGTVYHDKGNINFTFITTKVSERLHNYEYFLKPIIQTLNNLGIAATFAPKTHIYVGEHKISGNAQTYFKNKMVHHGTLLFDTDTRHLHNVLEKNSPIETYAIPSEHSSVINIKEIGNIGYTITEFMDYLTQEVGVTKKDVFELSNEQLFEIQTLSNTKYRTWEWVFGQTPSFSIIKENYHFEITNGYINNCSHYNNELKGLKYDKNSLVKHLESFKDKDKIIQLLFS